MPNDEQRPIGRTGKDEAKLLKGLREASIKTNVTWLRSVYEAKRAIAPDAVGAAGAPEHGKLTALDFSWLNDLLVDVASQHLANYNQALDLSAKYGDRFVAGLREVLRTRRSSTTTVQRQQVLELRGAAGGRAETTFSVRNSSQARAEVSFRMGEFGDVAGGPRFSATIEVRAEPAPADPATERILEPGETRVFRLGFDLHGPFAAAHRYATAFDVCVQGRVVEEVPMRVDVQ